MQKQSLRLRKPLAVVAMCGLLAAGCHARHAYTARVIGGPIQAAPATPIFPTPQPTLPPTHAHVAPPVGLQPLPGGPQPLIPATPQPVLPTSPGTQVQSNFPTQGPPVSAGIVLEKLGPAQAMVGSLVTYRIEVQSASGGARDVTVSDQLAAGLAYASSTPAAVVQGNILEWRLGDMRGGELRTIEVNFRAEQAGAFNNCAVARTIDGQTSQDCVSTTVLAPELEVRVEPAGSDTVVIGDRVTFQITVTNRSSLPARGLMITDRFDEGLMHDVAASPIEKDLGELAVGQSTTIGVTFRVIHAGRLCNHVEVRGESGLRGAADGCITAIMPTPGSSGQQPAPIVVPPPPTSNQPPLQGQPNLATPPQAQTVQPSSPRSLEVKVTGPDNTQQVDAVAEFNINVVNTGDAPLTNITIVASQDATLSPVQATDGHEWDDAGNLLWKFPSLAPGKSMRVQLNSRCRDVAAKACTRVRVSTQEGASGEDQACVEISRGESKLGMTVQDLADPVAAGKDLTYEVRVTNNGTAPARNVALLVIAPPEMSVIHLGTMGDRTTYGVDGQNVRFKPVAELLPGEKLTFRVRVRAQKAGDVMLEALLSADGMEQPFSVKEKTTVFEGGE